MQRAKHIRFFSVVYISTPKRSDVKRSVIIRIQNINLTILICTLKILVSAFADMFTARTGLRSVTRFYDHQLNAIKQGFIFKERPQLTKIPTSKFCSKLFVFTFRSKADISKVFNRNSFTLFFSRLHKGFTNSVIQYGSRCSFFATKPFQQLTSVARAFALNRTTNLLPMFTVRVKPIGRMLNTVRSYTNIRQTKIHAQEVFYVFDIFFGNVNGLKKIKFPFFVNQISLTLNVRQISRIMANKVNLLSATNTPQRNNVIRLVSHYSTVVSNTTKWFKLPFSFLVQLISICYFGYLPNNHLRRKLKCSFIRMVNFMVQLKVIENLFLPRHIRNGIANSISFLHRIEKQVSLFVSRQKFYFQRKFHLLLDTHKNTKSFLYQKIILNSFKFKGVSVSLTSHPHFVMSGFHASIL